jgi:hypothetical protein
VDQSALQAFLAEHGPKVLETCALRDWRVQFFASNNVSDKDAAGQCDWDTSRRTAQIVLQPAEIRDEQHAWEVLYHEVAHILTSQMCRVWDAADKAGLSEDLKAVLFAVYKDANEEITSNVGRALYQRHGPLPDWDRGRAI